MEWKYEILVGHIWLEVNEIAHSHSKYKKRITTKNKIINQN